MQMKLPSNCSFWREEASAHDWISHLQITTNVLQSNQFTDQSVTHRTSDSGKPRYSVEPFRYGHVSYEKSPGTRFDNW